MELCYTMEQNIILELWKLERWNYTIFEIKKKFGRLANYESLIYNRKNNGYISKQLKFLNKFTYLKFDLLWKNYASMAKKNHYGTMPIPMEL